MVPIAVMLIADLKDAVEDFTCSTPGEDGTMAALWGLGQSVLLDQISPESWLRLSWTFNCTRRNAGFDVAASHAVRVNLIMSLRVTARCNVT